MTTSPRKFFNTDDPCRPEDDYMLPPLPRLPDIGRLVCGGNHLVLRGGPRSGKTTLVKAAVARLNEEWAYRALYCPLEGVRGVSDPGEAMRGRTGSIFEALSRSPVESLRLAAGGDFREKLEAGRGFAATPVETALREIAARVDKELVVFFDDADSLTGPALIFFLSQLRYGWAARARTPFPRSFALVGVRNVAVYLVLMEAAAGLPGWPVPFDLIGNVLTAPYFTLDEVGSLYGQHTEATGQLFEAGAIERAWYWSEGQPWLVNALAKETIGRVLGCDFSRKVTEGHVDKAADLIMRRRETHIDSLAELLMEPRVMRIWEPMLTGADYGFDSGDKRGFVADLRYCLEFGLVRVDGAVRPTNQIIAGVVTRTLIHLIDSMMTANRSGRLIDGRGVTDMNGLTRSIDDFLAKHFDR